VANFVQLLVRAEGDRCEHRPIDDSENVQSGNDSGVLCRLVLSIVEIRRDCDNGVDYLSVSILSAVA
jgi:hypothetical protein